MINIGGDRNDRSYRYKMPPLVTKIEGRGNGIKTVVVNAADVAKHLKINAAYVVKWFGVELGAQSKWNEEKERAVVNGAHQTADMQAILTRFIARFVLCQGCGLPELNMKIKRGEIKTLCRACGHDTVIGGNHKLIGYIVKQATDGPTGKKKKKKKDKKEEKEDGGKKKKKKHKHKKDKSKNKEKDGSNDEASGGSGDERAPDGEKEETQPEEASEWKSDVSAAAQEERKQLEMAVMGQQNEKVTAILEEARKEGEEKSHTTLFKIFFAETDEPRTSHEIFSEIARLELAHSLDETKIVKMLLDVLIDVSDLKSVPAQFTKHAATLSRYTQRNGDTLLQCLEEFVGVKHPRLLQRTPMILKNLFDAEVLTEQGIVAWFELSSENSWLVNKEVSARVRQRAAPFVEWLQDADSSSDDDDE